VLEEYLASQLAKEPLILLEAEKVALILPVHFILPVLEDYSQEAPQL
jgi:hypothetical protein